MPSSMIFAGLVVIWLLLLVPAVARHRQEVARPSTAALGGRVLERPRRAQNVEVDVMDEVERPRAMATRFARTAVVDRDREPDPAPDVATAEDAGVGASDPDRNDLGRGDPARDEAALDDTERADPVRYDGAPGRDDRIEHQPAWSPESDDEYHDEYDEHADRPLARFRPGRGGFDPEAAALTARVRYAFRQRVVLVMLVAAVGTGVTAAVAVPGMWWLHVATDLLLVGYLGYLRRQVRIEEAIRARRAARMAGTRRVALAEGPDTDERADLADDAGPERDGTEFVDPPASPRSDPVSADRPDTASATPATAMPDIGTPDIGTLDPPMTMAGTFDRATIDHVPVPGDGPLGVTPDELVSEKPERVPGTGESLRPRRPERALPRLRPAPAPPLPPGTALVEADDEDLALRELDGPAQPHYRRAVGE